MDLKHLDPSYVTGSKLADNTVLTPIARLSFPHIADRDAFGRYSLGLLFNTSKPDDDCYVDVDAVLLPSLAEYIKTLGWNPKDPKVRLITNEEKYRKNGDVLEGYDGSNHHLSASYHDGPIPCYDGSTGHRVEADMFYAGCYVVALLQFYKPKPKIRNGATQEFPPAISIKRLYYVADGPRLGGAPPAPDTVPALPGAGPVTDL